MRSLSGQVEPNRCCNRVFRGVVCFSAHLSLRLLCVCILFFLYVHVVACCCSTVRVLRAYNHHCSCKLRLWWPGECSCFGVDRTEIFMACAILCFIWAHLRLFRSVNLESRKKHKHKHTHNDRQQTVTETTQSWGKNRPKFVIKIMEQLFSAHLSLRFFMIYFWTDNK